MSLQFANPMMLYALSAIAIPIIIHLFNFRKYKVAYFSNTRLLHEVTQQTKSKSQLKHILVLLARILAIASLALAFSQPYIPVTKKASASKAGNIVGLYIDNSFSMSGEGSNGQLLEEAKKRAEKIIKAYPASTDFIIQTNDDAAENHFVQTRDNAAEIIKAIELSPAPAKLSDINARIRSIAASDAPGRNTSTYYISDFQKSSSDFDALDKDSLSESYFITVSPRVTNNVYVDSCWFENPVHSLVQPDKIYVALKNSSDEVYTGLTVKLYINDSVKAFSSVNLKSGERKVVSLDYNNTRKGFVEGMVEITDYPVVYDNTYYISYSIAAKYRVSVINEGDSNPFLTSILASEPSIKAAFSNSNNINYSSIKNNDLVIIDGLTEISGGLRIELTSFVNGGGSLIIFPGTRIMTGTYNDLLQNTGIQLGGMDTSKTAAGNLNYKHPLFTNVFRKEITNSNLPVFFRHYKLSMSSKALSDVLLWSESREALAATVPFGEGQVLLCSSGCDDKATNLVKHPVFVPMIINSVFASASSQVLDCKVGADNLLKLRTKLSNEKMLHLVSADGKLDVIPGQVAATSESSTKLFAGANITGAGQYYITSDTGKITNVSFNFSRMDSRLDFYPPDEISTLAKEAGINAHVIDKPGEFTGETIKQIDQGTQLWKWFVTATLLFLLAEILLIRWKSKSNDARPPAA